jgi:hypothetical protein
MARPLHEVDLRRLLARRQAIADLWRAYFAASTHSDHEHMLRALAILGERVEDELARREAMAEALCPPWPMLTGRAGRC